MNRWTHKKILVLLIGVFVTLNMGLATVQANTMAFKMTMTSDMENMGHSDCGGCVSSGDNAKTIVCMPGCVASIPAVLPQAGVTQFSLSTVSFPLRNFRLTSRAYPPDPHPPKFSDLG